MNLSELWERLKAWFARRFFRLDSIEKFIESTDERYLDAQMWADIRGISTDEARDQLEQGVSLGYLERGFLYEWPDSPVQFLVPEKQLGAKVRLSDIGYIGEDDDREIVISRNLVRPVFIAAAQERELVS